jgi:hypothetical protein
MADQSVRAPFEYIGLAQREQTGHPEEGSIAMVCLFTFAASAAATLIVCVLTPAPPIPELWQRIGVNVNTKGKAKGASVAS